LRELFYDRRFIIPDNFIKFDEQFSSYLQIQSGLNVSFDTSSGEDHFLQAMQVFAIMEWQTENLPNINPKKETRKPSLGYFNF